MNSMGKCTNCSKYCQTCSEMEENCTSCGVDAILKNGICNCDSGYG